MRASGFNIPLTNHFLQRFQAHEGVRLIMPIELAVALMTSAAGIIVAGITAYFQYRSTVAKKKQDEDDARQKALDEANKKLQEAERKAEAEKLDTRLRSFEESIQSVKSDMTGISRQIESIRQHTSNRIAESEDGIRMITTILSKDARARSNMVRMYAKSEAQLRTLMEIQTYTLKFTKETASAIHTIGTILSRNVEEDDPETSQRLIRCLDDNNARQQQFVDNVITAQRTFFDQGQLNGDNETEAEIERINAILAPKKRNNSDDGANQS